METPEVLSANITSNPHPTSQLKRQVILVRTPITNTIIRELYSYIYFSITRKFPCLGCSPQVRIVPFLKLWFSALSSSPWQYSHGSPYLFSIISIYSPCPLFYSLPCMSPSSPYLCKSQYSTHPGVPRLGSEQSIPGLRSLINSL